MMDKIILKQGVIGKCVKKQKKSVKKGRHHCKKRNSVATPEKNVSVSVTPAV